MSFKRADFRLKKNDLGLHSADLRPLGSIKQWVVGTEIYKDIFCAIHFNDIIPLGTIVQTSGLRAICSQQYLLPFRQQP